jgi:serum/glucocorticoid-regulated kinase 2
VLTYAVVWSIGAILHEILYGIPPFYEEDLERYKLNICGDDSLVLPDSPPISEAASNILLRLLHKSPSERIGS